MMKFILIITCIAIALATTPVDDCTNESVSTGQFGGLYTTDGQPGIETENFIRWKEIDGIRGGKKLKICSMGVRFPHPSRVTHCVPGTNPQFCPPGAGVNTDFNFPNYRNTRYFVFKSMGFGVNPQGHPNGNYEQFAKQANHPGPSGWSWAQSHVDAHFFFHNASVTNSINWAGFPVEPPPANIGAKCMCEGRRSTAAPFNYYSEEDCVPHMGRHWAEDKLEPASVFSAQPALIFGTYDCKPNFWEPMIATPIFDWVRDNGPNGQAIISWPQPERYHKSGYYPTHYGIQESPNQIGNGRTVQISMNNFVWRWRGFRGAFKRQ